MLEKGLQGFNADGGLDAIGFFFRMSPRAMRAAGTLWAKAM